MTPKLLAAIRERDESTRVTADGVGNSHGPDAAIDRRMLLEYVTELEGTLRRIATPHDCGCRPCHCADSAPAMLIELDEVRSMAAEALK